MIKTLQNLILESKPNNYSELYYRCDGYVFDQNDGILLESRKKIVTSFSFDTYFNSFSLYAWKKYTNIGKKLFLDISFQGVGDIDFFAVDEHNGEIKLCSYRLSSKERSNRLLEIPAHKGVLIFFRIITEKFAIFSGSWKSEIDDIFIKNINISTAICTYKREKFVLNTLNKIISLKSKYRELDDKINVYVSDNGNTIKHTDLPSSDIKLYYNQNSGGAGGFSRCMFEILENSPQTTHILIMDDDIELEPESIFRTITFLEILKSEYDGHTIGGAMLNIRKKTIQSAREESIYLTPPIHKNLRPDVDIKNRYELVVNDGPQKWDNLYAAWWYCAIPITMLRNGLAFPLFFQCDDIEFSLRNNANTIHLNGISVWHEPFYAKMSPSKEYYLIRNILIIGSLYKSNIFIIILYICFRMCKNLCSFNYSAIEYIIDAIYAFLDGPAKLPVENWTEKPDHSPSYIARPTNRQLPEKNYQQISKLKLIFVALTLNGALLPNCFLKSISEINPKFTYIVKDICFTKKIVEYRDSICLEYNMSRKKSILCTLNFIKSIVMLLFKYKKAKKEWGEKKNIFTAIKWWKEKFISSN